MNKRKLKKFYLSLIPKIRKVARQSGYAIGLHGSLIRDLDIIGVPWIDKCVTAEILLKRIAKKLDAFYSFGNCKKPHGRKAYLIYFKIRKNIPASAYIDFSILPTIKKCGINHK